jgi:hypothetical protein
MAKITVIGIVLVQLALLFYTLFYVVENKKQRTTNLVLVLITIAVLFDIGATTCMMIGTTRTYFTFHGIIGYIGLLLMLTDAILLWRHKIQQGAEVLISKQLRSYSKYAYYWWLVAFFTGVAVSIFRQ